MHYQLLGDNIKENFAEELLRNRGISGDLHSYVFTKDSDVESYDLLDNVHEGCALLHKHLAAKNKILILEDSDVDGITSSALLFNFIKGEVDKTANLEFAVHESKAHGLSDVISFVLNKTPKLVICPDSSSNDEEFHKQLREKGIDVLVIDHHECDTYSKYAVTINNQMSPRYENKQLSAAGVVWQFLRCYNDMYLGGKVQMENYLDIAAIGNCADQMSLRSKETKHLMHYGFSHPHSPIVKALFKAQEFSMKGVATPISVAFYIAPMLNAVTRVGTLDEKRNLFEAFLTENADKVVPSTKRGASPGDTENFVEQQIRIAGNVRNRQNKMVDEMMEVLVQKIEEEKLYNHKLLLLDVPEDAIAPEVVGLIANKIAAKYQHPTILTRRIGDNNKGSLRNFAFSPIENFRSQLEASGLVQFAQGHESAAGVAFSHDKTTQILDYFDNKWKDVEFSSSYKVDFIFDYHQERPDLVACIKNIGELNKLGLWGQDVPEPYIVIKNLPLSRLRFFEKRPTIRIDCAGFNAMKFKSSAEEYALFNEGKSADIVCTCNLNEWRGQVTPQVFIADYELHHDSYSGYGWDSF